MTLNYELKPKYDHHVSFYGKAVVLSEDGDRLKLYSYGTHVATICETNHGYSIAPYAEVYGWYSATTARHINEFLKQHGFLPMTKQQMNNGFAPVWTGIDYIPACGRCIHHGKTLDDDPCVECCKHRDMPNFTPKGE